MVGPNMDNMPKNRPGGERKQTGRYRIIKLERGKSKVLAGKYADVLMMLDTTNGDVFSCELDVKGAFKISAEWELLIALDNPDAYDEEDDEEDDEEKDEKDAGTSPLSFLDLE